MSMEIELWPIAIVEDRYDGVYSGGSWLAIAKFDHSAGDGLRTRLGLVMDGAHGDDMDAMSFGDDQPEWYAVGNSPQQALDALRRKHFIATNKMTPEQAREGELSHHDPST